MKQIFKDISARLALLPELEWVDKDKGQMNYERPPILFPAALLTLSVNRAENISKTLQGGQLQLRVKLCFGFAGNTNAKTPAQDLDRSLEYYDIVDKVFAQLQGWGTGEFNPLERVSFVPIQRPDGYTTEEMVFTADFREDAAV